MLVNNVLRPVASNLLKVPSRSTSAVVGARSRHVPNSEKTVLVAGMFAAILFTPCWILLHLKDYKKKDD